MYLLFVDESGTHAGDHPFVLGGLAVHEDDAARFQRELDQLVINHLGRVPVNLDEFEINAGEMRNAKKSQIPAKKSASGLTILGDFGSICCATRTILSKPSAPAMRCCHTRSLG